MLIQAVGFLSGMLLGAPTLTDTNQIIPLTECTYDPEARKIVYTLDPAEPYLTSYSYASNNPDPLGIVDALAFRQLNANSELHFVPNDTNISVHQWSYAKISSALKQPFELILAPEPWNTTLHTDGDLVFFSVSQRTAVCASIRLNDRINGVITPNGGDSDQTGETGKESSETTAFGGPETSASSIALINEAQSYTGDSTSASCGLIAGSPISNARHFLFFALLTIALTAGFRRAQRDPIDLS